MSGVENQAAIGWDWLLEAAKEQGALFETMRKTTQWALEAAKENDTAGLQEALLRREELMQRVESWQAKEREFRSKVAGLPPAQLDPKLSTAQDYILDQLEKTTELNVQLEQELLELRRRLDRERDKVNKLRQTAQGYRPKDLSSEGLFVDRRR